MLDVKNLSLEWINSNYDSLSNNESRLVDAIEHKDSFYISGAPEDIIESVAFLYRVEVIRIKLDSIDVLRGNVVTAQSESGIGYFYYDVEWAHPIMDNPTNTYMVVVDIDDADDRTFQALSSYIKAHDIQGQRCENFFVCVTCSNKERVINQTMKSILRPRIIWAD